MRLWSLHPQYLDVKGLLAVWREGLLARAVLLDNTRGYRSHPQLLRFRAAPDPIAAVDVYLNAVCDEADRRGYHFDHSKIGETRSLFSLPVTRGQIAYERQHLLNKLRSRDPSRVDMLTCRTDPELNPLFFQVEGDVESWEKGVIEY